VNDNGGDAMNNDNRPTPETDRAEELGKIAMRGGIIHGCNVEQAATRIAAAINTALYTSRTLERQRDEARAEYTNLLDCVVSITDPSRAGYKDRPEWRKGGGT